MLKIFKENKISIIMWLIFESVAAYLFLTTKNIFYLFNFTYIGTCLALATFFTSHQKKYARTFAQFSIGLYMFFYLGIICKENMQIEGFWYYLFLGVFEGATIHYFVAKIVGPLFFGRGWCGYACWTGMVLDLLPYKTSTKRYQKLSWIRYIFFFLSLITVVSLFVFNISHKDQIMFYLFLAGNLLYYVIGITLAFILKDNRAFCKYICPITIFLKPASNFAYLRVKCDHQKCIKCQKCLKNCPMNVDILDNSPKRKNKTECILCCNCIKNCPQRALKL